MSESKYEHDVCPFCELPMAKDEQEAEYQHRLKLVGYDEKNPDLVKWEDQYCWQGWDHAGTATEDRLVEVLEQRDALREQVAELAGYHDALRTENEKLHYLLGRGAQESLDNAMRYLPDA